MIQAFLTIFLTCKLSSGRAHAPLLAKLKPNWPASGGQCRDPDPVEAGEISYRCPEGMLPKTPGDPHAACIDEATCNANCCLPHNEPMAGGKCSKPNPHSKVAIAFICPPPLTAKFGSAQASCTEINKCVKHCCKAVPFVTVTVTEITTSTITPYDSSYGSLGTSLDSNFMDSWNDKDFSSESNSGESSGFNVAGSAGFYLPVFVWCWLLLLSYCCCLLLGCLLIKALPSHRDTLASRRFSSKSAREPLSQQRPAVRDSKDSNCKHSGRHKSSEDKAKKSGRTISAERKSKHSKHTHAAKGHASDPEASMFERDVLLPPLVTTMPMPPPMSFVPVAQGKMVIQGVPLCTEYVFEYPPISVPQPYPGVVV